jgi:hypothetical protein
MKKSAANYTKGPWVLSDKLTFNGTNKNGQTKPLFVKQQLLSGNKAAMMLQHDNADEGNANARLIAAAPELLKFAKHVLSQIESGACGYVDGTEAELKSYAAALIAKAEGKK